MRIIMRNLLPDYKKALAFTTFTMVFELKTACKKFEDVKMQNALFESDRKNVTFADISAASQRLISLFEMNLVVIGGHLTLLANLRNRLLILLQIGMFRLLNHFLILVLVG